MNYEKAGVKFDAIEKEIGLKFKDHALLGQAFVHDSYLNEHQDLRSNERLEFLGDAVVNLAAAHHLYKTSEAPEGMLTEARKSLVSDPALAKTARSLHLGDYIILSNGEQASGGRDKESILAGCFEALVGAVFLQFDYYEADRFLLKTLLVASN